jgi:hypothetical protein
VANRAERREAHDSGHQVRRSDRQTRGDGARASDGGRTRTIAAVVADARRDLQELLGRPIERVSSAVPDDHGWRLSVDIVELERIPDSTSVLGCYEVVLDDGGAVVEYERVRRYYRNRTDEEIP